jgi:hypothetical protein
MSTSDDEAKPQPSKKCKVAGFDDDTTKKLRSCARTTMSLEVQKIKSLIIIPHDVDDSTMALVIK